MAHVLLFHHARGLTDGLATFADDLRSHGHQVTVPDLYDGRTFPTTEAGVEHAERVGFDAIVAAGEAAAAHLPAELVYAGFSLGVLPAQRLAQTRPGARGALLYHGGVPLGTFGDRWPDGVPLQLHVMRDDPWEDVGTLGELAAGVPDGELFVYPGSGHLFTDRSLDEYDGPAAALVLARSLELLDRASTRPGEPAGGR